MNKQPSNITPILLEALLMPNGEVLCLGKTIGWFKELQKFIRDWSENENAPTS